MLPATSMPAALPATTCSFDHDPQMWKDPAGRAGLRLRGAVASHTGHHREGNEDRFLLRPDAGLFVVADGMGGHEAGEVAATLAVESMASIAEPQVARAAVQLRHAVADANTRILAATAKHARKTGMGTTLSALWFQGDRAFIAHVGDSRVYRLRAGRLEQITEDHTLLADAIRAGFDPTRAKVIFPSNVLTRAVGIRGEVEPLVVECGVLPGDRFLLCSDGLTDMIPETLITDRLALWPSASNATQALLEDALDAGGHDNVTVLVVDAG